MNLQNFKGCGQENFPKPGCFCFVAGPTGPSGATGPTGPAAMTVEIGNIRTGEPFEEASVQNVGTPSNIVLDFVIPSGMPGPTGATGPQGEPGPQGDMGPQGLTGIEGPTGPTGPAAGLNAYGGLFSTTNQAVTKIDTPLTVNLDTPMEDYYVTGANNTVTIVEGGIYEINYTLSATLNDTSNLVVEVRNAGKPIDGSKATLELTSGVTGTLAKSIIIDLEDGAALSLVVISSTSQSGGNINQATLSVKLLD